MSLNWCETFALFRSHSVELRVLDSTPVGFFWITRIRKCVESGFARRRVVDARYRQS
jgi:hypothetical protein